MPSQNQSTVSGETKTQQKQNNSAQVNQGCETGMQQVRGLQGIRLLVLMWGPASWQPSELSVLKSVMTASWVQEKVQCGIREMMVFYLIGQLVKPFSLGVQCFE